MAISVVKIANMALSHLGVRSRIEALTENSAEAAEVNLWYDLARQQALEALDWPFARKRRALALHSEDADLIKWSFRYQRPEDAIAIREIPNPSGPTADAVPYDQETAPISGDYTIVTNMEDAEVIYTFDQTNVLFYSPMFVEALSYMLAHHICMKLTGQKDLRQQMLQSFFMTARAAQAFMANQAVTDPPREAEWVRGR